MVLSNMKLKIFPLSFHRNTGPIYVRNLETAMDKIKIIMCVLTRRSCLYMQLGWVRIDKVTFSFCLLLCAGFEAPNLRKLADKIAGAGYFVAVPDCFNKDTFIPGASPLGDWLKNHHPVDFLEDARKLVDTLKTKGFSSVGAAGFCWGAKVVVDLAKNDFLKAAVLCHPSLVTVEDISAVKTPLAVLAAEIDQMTPPELAKQFSEILESNKEVESFFHLYPGVAHGWTVRYDVNDESAVIRAEEAHCKMMEWFGKFLH